MFNIITCKQIAYAMQQADACSLQMMSVWKIPDPARNGEFYAVKHLNYEEAIYHEKNAKIIALTNLPVAKCAAIKIEDAEIGLFEYADPDWMNGFLLMEYAYSEILSEYKDRISGDERTKLFDHLKENTLAGCIISNHLDPNESNILCQKIGSEVKITFIDMEDSLAGQVVPTKDLLQDMTEDPEGRPHYYGVNNSHHIAIAENAAQIVKDLKQTQKNVLNPEISFYIPEMIDRGLELISLMQCKKSKAFYNF